VQINKIRVHHIKLPFAFDFSHSLRKRSSAKNVIVEIIAEQGKIKGYGEGAPRSYVTGESQDSAVKSIQRFLKKSTFPWDLNDVSQIRDFVDSLSKDKDHNAAICALETALLDALGKRQNRYIMDYFSQDFIAGDVYYGVSIPLADKQTVSKLCQLSRKMNISKLRLKLGKDFEQNKAIIETVHSVFGKDCDQRADINCSWDKKLAFKHISLIEKYKIRVVEQPMALDDLDVADFAGAMQASGVVLMADESACSLSDVKKIVKEGYYKMVNVRLSKCGGFRKSLEIIDYLRSNKISFQTGCHLGESGVLSAAGRVLCLLCRDAVYYDGSYDNYLLKENITRENVTFGSGGKAGPLTGPGLGVEVNRQNLARLSAISDSITSPATLKQDLLLRN